MGRYVQAPIDPAPDRLLLVVAFVVCAALGPMIVIGVPVEVAAAVAALVITVSA